MIWQNLRKLCKRKHGALNESHSTFLYILFTILIEPLLNLYSWNCRLGVQCNMYYLGKLLVAVQLFFHTQFMTFGAQKAREALKKKSVQQPFQSNVLFNFLTVQIDWLSKLAVSAFISREEPLVNVLMCCNWLG